MREIERRSITSPVEWRAAEGGVTTLTGYAALYDSLSENLGGFREVLRRGCFDRAVREDDVMCRAEHDSKMLLGRTSNGTCRLSLDEKGLRYEVDLPDTQPARDIGVLVRRGDVRGSSFAFVISSRAGERWGTCEDGLPLREVLDCGLIDCAPVSSPAYLATTVSARALEEARMSTTAKTEERAEDEAAEDTAELIEYKLLAQLFAQVQQWASTGQAQVVALIAGETQDAGGAPPDEAGEEALEEAGLAVVQAAASQISSTGWAISMLAWQMCQDEADEQRMSLRRAKAVEEFARSLESATRREKPPVVAEASASENAEMDGYRRRLRASA